MREADLTQWDAFVIMSGDGLLFEVTGYANIHIQHTPTASIYMRVGL